MLVVVLGPWPWSSPCGRGHPSASSEGSLAASLPGGRQELQSRNSSAARLERKLLHTPRSTRRRVSRSGSGVSRRWGGEVEDGAVADCGTEVTGWPWPLRGDGGRAQPAGIGRVLLLPAPCQRSLSLRPSPARRTEGSVVLSTAGARVRRRVLFQMSRLLPVSSRRGLDWLCNGGSRMIPPGDVIVAARPVDDRWWFCSLFVGDRQHGRAPGACSVAMVGHPCSREVELSRLRSHRVVEQHRGVVQGRAGCRLATHLTKVWRGPSRGKRLNSRGSHPALGPGVNCDRPASRSAARMRLSISRHQPAGFLHAGRGRAAWLWVEPGLGSAGGGEVMRRGPLPTAWVPCSRVWAAAPRVRQEHGSGHLVGRLLICCRPSSSLCT